MKVPVEKDVLKWAIGYSQKTYEDLEKKFPRLQFWLEGNDLPTMKQLKNFAQHTQIPIGYLLLSKPPENIMKNMPEFRTLSSSANTQLSKNLIDTINIVKRRQDWLREYRQKEGYEKITFIGAYDGSDINGMVNDAYTLLGVQAGWQCGLQGKNQVLIDVINRLERAGVSVFINGIVGNNTSRTLKVEEFRGFTLIDWYAPIIFINGADTKAAQLFTLLHEFGHLLLGQEGVTNNLDGEVLCNRFAASFLVPEEIFFEEWQHCNGEYDVLAQKFKVSKLTIYRIAYTYNKINKDLYEALVSEFYEEFWSRKKKESGGNFYKTAVYRIGRSFGITVDRAAREGELLYGDAYDLLGVKGNTYDKVIKELVSGRDGGM